MSFAAVSIGQALIALALSSSTLAAFIAGWWAFKTSKRVNSGSAATATGGDMLKEGSEFRRALMEDRNALTAQVAELTRELWSVKQTLLEVKTELSTHRIAAQENEILRAANAHLIAELRQKEAGGASE